jgi:hypothetical protein
MKKYLFLSGLIIGLSATPLYAQSVDFDIHIGNRPVPPPVVMAPPPPPIAAEAPPNMVFMSGVGVYTAVGVPYDLFFYNNSYYYHHNGFWYRSAYFRGPWSYAEPRFLPAPFMRHRIEELRDYRRHAWEDHRERGVRFRERHFRAEEPDERHGREFR